MYSQCSTKRGQKLCMLHLTYRRKIVHELSVRKAKLYKHLQLYIVNDIFWLDVVITIFG